MDIVGSALVFASAAGWWLLLAVLVGIGAGVVEYLRYRGWW